MSDTIVRETTKGNIEIIFANNGYINNIIITRETAKKVVDLFKKYDVENG